MHAVVRTYSGKGAKELIDLIEKNKPEVERLIRGVKGFVSYSLVRTADGGFSVSVYQDKAGTDESIRVAWDWIAKNASATGVTASVAEGTVLLQLK
jgi:predicted ATP-dependent Lon-type protease